MASIIAAATLAWFAWIGMELIMRRIILMTAFVVGLIAPASAQKAEIEAVNAKWIEFFNKGDFAGVASLYTTDATAFPQGSAMVQGRSRHWEQCSKAWRKELAIRN